MRAKQLISILLMTSGVLLSACTPTQSQIDEYSVRCFESGTTNPINTKVVGANFNLTLTFYRNNAVTALTSDVISQLTGATLGFAEATDRTSCQSASGVIEGVTIPTLNLVVGQTTSNLSNITISRASRNLVCRLNLSNNNSPKCSDSSFAVRPASFTVTSVANADNAGTNANAGSTGAGNLIKAGTNFSISAVTGAAGYNGTPTINLARVEAHAGNIQTGTLTGSFPAANANSGTATGTNFTYSEVGYFRLFSDAIRDSTFTSTDRSNNRCISGSSSNTPVGGRVGCDIAMIANTSYFGRFIPNGFKATPQTVTLGCNSGGFTYFGGEFSTQFDLEAVNASNVVTRNYHGAFAKFATNAIATDYARYDVQPANLTNPVSTVALTQGTQAPLINTAWNQGKATITLNHRIGRPASDTQPQSPVLNLLPTDGEATTASNTAITTATGATSIPMRYGRATVANAYGAETMPLTFDVFTQFYDNTGKWVTNTADNCTSLLPSAFTPTFPGGAGNNLTSAYQTNGWLTNVGNFAGGKGKFKLRAPGHGNNGWLLLSTPVVTELGAAQQMRASFGQYKSSLIYSREN